MAKKISDNPSFKKMKSEMKFFRIIIFFMQLLAFVRIIDKANLKKIRNQFAEAKSKMSEIGNSLDKFNKLFSKHGWIIYESLNSNVSDEAIKMAEGGNISEAEKLLVDHYDEKLLTDKIRWLRAVPELQKRVAYINKAKEDYLNERYHSCIPLLLMMIDGATTDINQSRGFTNGLFSSNVDLKAWDSLSGHESGLLKLAELFNKGRLKTNELEISIPYRNGILHGRELNFDNKVVAAKLWGLLFAVRDWAVALRKSIIEDKPKTQRSIAEILTKQQDFKNIVTNWKPRNVVIGKDIPISGVISDFVDFTPERATVEFIFLMKSKNYGNMIKVINKLSKYGETDKEILIRLRKLFTDINFIDFKFTKIRDLNFDTTEDTVELEIEYLGKKSFLELSFRWDYVDQNGTSMALGQKGGTWYLLENLSERIELFKNNK